MKECQRNEGKVAPASSTPMSESSNTYKKHVFPGALYSLTQIAIVFEALDSIATSNTRPKFFDQNHKGKCPHLSGSKAASQIAQVQNRIQSGAGKGSG